MALGVTLALVSLTAGLGVLALLEAALAVALIVSVIAERAAASRAGRRSPPSPADCPPWGHQHTSRERRTRVR